MVENLNVKRRQKNVLLMKNYSSKVPPFSHPSRNILLIRPNQIFYAILFVLSGQNGCAL